jgi:osmotically-inducible protein OsmY
MLLCAVAAVFSCGCGWLDDDQAAALRDGRVAVNLHTAIHSDPRLAGSDVSFRVRPGEILIQGNTLTENQRALAEAIARGTAGAKYVVKLENEPGRPAVAKRANFGLLRDLSSVIALKQQLRVRGLGSGVQMDVDGELVTVYGEVDSKGERRSIVAMLMADPEVSQVVDNTHLKSESGGSPDWRSAFDDSVVAGKIKLAMKLNKRLSEQSISVKTRQSEVTLSGSVDSRKQAALAAQIAADVAGVTKVVNKLAVGSPPKGRSRRTRGD